MRRAVSVSSLENFQVSPVERMSHCEHVLHGTFAIWILASYLSAIEARVSIHLVWIVADSKGYGGDV